MKSVWKLDADLTSPDLGWIDINDELRLPDIRFMRKLSTLFVIQPGKGWF